MAVSYTKEGKIAIFTLNRPEALNSINVEAAQELHDALVDFRDDEELWVGIITGAGEKAFSAGADIKDMLPFGRANSHRPWAMPDTPMRGFTLWKPLIAAINGYALGGGLEIVLSCDLRIATENARFGLPEISLGLIPGWGGTQRLPRMIPKCKAAELLLMGQPIDVQEAYRIGLINKVVPQEKLMSTAKEWANTICEMGPLAVRAAKEAMIKGCNMTLEDGLYLEHTLDAYLMGTEDFNEGITAFAEKPRRKPVYKGK